MCPNSLSLGFASRMTDDGCMAEHHHHWVLIDGYSNAYSCCECGDTKGEKRILGEVRPVHSRRLLTNARMFQRKRAGSRGAV